jgi:Ca2+-binding EF-hand superfamily protein
MLGRTAGMTVDELLIRIKDRIMLHNRDMPSAFRVFDRTNKGKISKREFREVCMPMFA